MAFILSQNWFFFHKNYRILTGRSVPQRYCLDKFSEYFSNVFIAGAFHIFLSLLFTFLQSVSFYTATKLLAIPRDNDLAWCISNFSSGSWSYKLYVPIDKAGCFFQVRKLEKSVFLFFFFYCFVNTCTFILMANSRIVFEDTQNYNRVLLCFQKITR